MRVRVGKIGDFRTFKPSITQKRFHPEILRGFSWAGALNDGVGKIGDFRPLSRHISETVQGMIKVVIDH